MCFQCIQDHESVSRFLARGARRPGSERRWRGPGCGRPAPAVRALLRLALELDDGTLRLEVRQPELAVAPVAVHLHGSANPGMCSGPHLAIRRYRPPIPRAWGLRPLELPHPELNSAEPGIRTG